MSTEPPSGRDPSPPPLPGWLRGREGRGASRPREGAPRFPGPFARGALTGVLLTSALAAGLFLWWRAGETKPAALACPEPPPTPPVTAPCPAPAAPKGASAPPPPATKGTRHAAAQPPVSPLPPDPVPEEAKRREALRAYAASRAGELKSCVSTPNRGPVRRIGAALVIDAAGNVAAVQLLGAETQSSASRCYAERLRAWKFPTESLRGQERLLVNFVL